MRRLLPALLVGLVLSGCAGESALERCVAHSAEEGVDRAVAEQACAEVVDEG